MFAKFRLKIALVFVDMFALSFSGLVGLCLRFNGWPEAPYIRTWGYYLLVGVPLYFVVYYYLGLYRHLWYYATASDLLTITGAVSIASISLYGIMHIGLRVDLLWSVLVIAWFINVLVVGGARFALRLRADLIKRSTMNGSKRTLILGAGDAGRILMEEIAKHPELDYKPIGFLDDDVQKVGLQVAGLPVLAKQDMLEETVLSHGASNIIIAMPSAPSAKVKDLVQCCAMLGIKPKLVPGLYRVLNGGFNLNSLREVQLEDLLSRPEIKTDCAGIVSYVQSKTVLITGAGGSIGSELARQVAHFGAGKLLLLGHGENSIYQIHKELRQNFPRLALVPLIADIQDRPRIDEIFANHKPQVVFHAAAYKHVPLMEHNPVAAIKNNIFGTRHVVEAANKYRAECFVLISTDKAVNPYSVMGATKRFAEMLVQSTNLISASRFVAVRFGNVLGSRGSVVPLFKEQIARGGPVTVTHPDMTRYLMTIPEAVSLVIQAGSMGKGGEVFVLDMGAPVKIVDLARDMIILSGLKPDQDIRIEYTGIRPGEKLFEELLTAEEGIGTTQHQRIFIARQRVPDTHALSRALESFGSLVESGCQGKEVLDLVLGLAETPAQVTLSNANG